MWITIFSVDNFTFYPHIIKLNVDGFVDSNRNELDFVRGVVEIEVLLLITKIGHRISDDLVALNFLFRFEPT